MKKVSAGLILIAIAAISFWAGGRYVQDRPDSPAAQQAERKILYYTDPMNPGFRSDKPGVAPCGMALEPVYADDGEGLVSSSSPHSSGTIRISPERQQLIGVKVAPVTKAPMSYSLRLYGRVVPDETRVFRLNASTDSWIKKLSNVTTGSIVSKNQILAEALAPAYYNAQLTYLIAMDNVDRIKQQLGGDLRPQQGDIADNQIRLAVQSLQNLGISDAQVEELANTRKARPYLQIRAPSRGVVLSRNVTLSQWFKAGEEFYSIADIGKVWVYANVYEQEARHLRPGMTVKVKHAQLGKTFNAKVSEVLSLFDPVSKTLKVRLDVDNHRYELRPDMFVDVEIPLIMPPSLHVPADAVIDSGTKKIVYVETGKGTFEPCQVETGWRLGRRVEITGGLLPGEKIIVSGNFLVDSESRMKTAASGIDAGFVSVPEKLEGQPAPMEHTPVVKSARDEDSSALAAMDPVCRMNIYRKEAEKADLTVTLSGKTYYFCTRECLRSFVKEPEKYLGKKPPVTTRQERAVKPELKHDAGGQGKKQNTTGGRTGASAGNAASNGPETEKKAVPAKDWRGWGKFPGAEYLGLKDRAKNTSGRKPDLPGAAGAKQDKNAQDSPAPVVEGTDETPGEVTPDGTGGTQGND
jgi:RND family efflux transporter MFP subunit